MTTRFLSRSFLAAALLAPALSADTLINEVDCDQSGTDASEFIELFGSTGAGSLEDHFVVLYNGSTNLEYLTFDLDGQSMPADGFFVIAAAGGAVPNTDFAPGNFPATNAIQNGQDAVALYFDPTGALTSSSFTGTNVATPPAGAVLVDAVVYGTSDPDDPELLAALTPGQPQADENANGNGVGESISRCPDGGVALQTGTYVAQAPTPGTTNCIGTVLYRGLEHSPLGGAQLALDPGDSSKLVVANIGSSGLDGISIDLGQVSTFNMHHTDAFDPAVLPDGAYIETTMHAPVDGVPDQVVLVGRMEVVSGQVQVSVDFSPVGATTHTIDVYDDDELVAHVTGHSGPAFTTDKLNVGLVSEYNDRDNPKCGSYCYEWVAVEFHIVGGPTVLGNQVVITQENKTKTVGRYTNATVMAADVGTLRLFNEQIGIFDNLHEALGNVTFTATDDFVTPKLEVGNIGSSGVDGVIAYFPPSDSMELLLADSTLGGGNGSWLSASAFGSVAGVPDQPLGSATFTKQAGGYDVTADFSAIGSPTQRIQVLDGGLLVLDLPGHTGPVATMSNWPYKLGKLGGTTECLVSCSDVGTVFLIDGSNYVGTELRILAETNGSAIDYKSSFELLGSGLDAIDIVGEANEPTPYTNLGGALAGGAGEPHLIGAGPLTGGSLNVVSLTNAAPSSICGLFLSFSSTPVPFKGGVLQAFPPAGDPLILPTSPAGSLHVPFVMVPGIPAGITLYMQYAISDLGAPKGVAFSNAIVGVFP